MVTPRQSPPPDNITLLIAGLPRLLTISQVAMELQVSVRHVHRLLAAGQLRAHKLTPTQRGAVRIPRDAVADFLRHTAA